MTHKPTAPPNAPGKQSGDVVFAHGKVILPDSIIDDGAVLVRDGRILAVGSRASLGAPTSATLISADGGYISPGFIDIHIHGGDGADYMDGTPDAARTVNRAHARHGVTTLFPTTSTGHRHHLDNMLRSARTVRDNWSAADGSRIAGVHFYGPYFASDKVGIHPPQGRRDPTTSVEEYNAHFDLGVISIATCAAELPGATEFYDEARRRGCFITCGHSNSSWPEMKIAFDHGMRHVDHFWSAMSSVPSLRPRFGVPMQASMEQFVIAHREMSTEVIADGCHLSPELLEYAFMMKGADRLCLVSDTSRAMDMPPGDYTFGPPGLEVKFTSDGQMGFEGTRAKPASSIIALDHAIRQMKKDTRATLPQVIRMASLTPAERTGIAADYGSLAAGKVADIVLLDDNLKVKQTYLGGQAFK